MKLENVKVGMRVKATGPDMIDPWTYFDYTGKEGEVIKVISPETDDYDWDENHPIDNRQYVLVQFDNGEDELWYMHNSLEQI